MKAAAAKGAEKRGILEEDSGGKDSLFLLSIQWESCELFGEEDDLTAAREHTAHTVCVCVFDWIYRIAEWRERIYGGYVSAVCSSIFTGWILSLSFSLRFS